MDSRHPDLVHGWGPGAGDDGGAELRLPTDPGGYPTAEQLATVRRILAAPANCGWCCCPGHRTEDCADRRRAFVALRSRGGR